MWYVIQTTTGREEELTDVLKSMLPQTICEKSFFIRRETCWRLKGKHKIQQEVLFPGYVFIVSDTPKELYLCLKKVPAMSKMIADGNFDFLSIEEEEEAFFANMLKNQHIVRLSYVELDGKGRILRVCGPLKEYADSIVKAQYKKRYVIIRLKMMGSYKTVALGVILKEDIQQEIRYGKVETPLEMPEFYHAAQPEKNHGYAAGDHVSVISGSFENMSGVIWKVKKRYGRDRSTSLRTGHVHGGAGQ